MSVTRPIRKVPSAPSMTAVGVFDRGGEERRQERLIGRGVVLLDPAEIAALRRGRGIGRDALGDRLPVLAGLEVGEGRVGLGLGRGLLRVRRHRRALVDCRSDRDLPGVALLGVRRLDDEPGVHVGVRDLDALGRGEACLDPGVDDPFEGEGGQLLLLLLDELRLGVGLGLGQMARRLLGPDARDRLGQAPVLDLCAVAQLVLADRLARDAPDRRQVRVVVGGPGHHDEDEHGGDDDDREAEVEVEVPPVVALPRGTL